MLDTNTPTRRDQIHTPIRLPFSSWIFSLSTRLAALSMTQIRVLVGHTQHALRFAHGVVRCQNTLSW
jgi:hypothetical protein